MLGRTDRERIHFGYVRELNGTVVAYVDRYGRGLWLQDGKGAADIVATGMLGSVRKDQLEEKYLYIDEVFRELE